jgi:hypothetical protein
LEPLVDHPPGVRQQLVIALPRVELTEGIERPQRGGEID